MWAVEEISDDDDKDIEEMQREVEDILSKITAKKRKATNTNQAPLQFSVKVKVEKCNEPPPPQPNKPDQNNINITNNPNNLLQNSQKEDDTVEGGEYYQINKNNGFTLSDTPPSTSQKNNVLELNPLILNYDYKLQNRSEETLDSINNTGNEVIQKQPLNNNKLKHFTFTNNQIKDEMEKLSMSSTNPVDKHIHMLPKNLMNVPTPVTKSPQELALEKREVEDILSKITAKKRKATNKNQAPSKFSAKVKVAKCNEPPPPQPNKPNQNNINITNNPNNLLQNSQKEDDTVEGREYCQINKNNGITLSDTPPSTSQENNVLEPNPLIFNYDYKLQNRSEETLDSINNTENEVMQKQPLNDDKFKHFTFTNNQIKDEMEKLSMSSTNPVDKHIHMLAKNLMNVPTPVTKSPQELALEKVLMQWRNWYLQAPDIREAPLQYRCSVCGVGWWHYYEFQEHLKTQHISYNVHMTLRFQAANHESYIIASKKHSPFQKALITTPCWRCGLTTMAKCKNYDVSTRTYRCSCGSEHPTCTLYRLHLDVCKINNPKSNNEVIYKCHLCFFKFTSSQTLTVHKILSHSVRSDLPCAWPKYECKLCNIPLENISWHDCPKMNQYIMCRYCPKTFTGTTFLNLHYKIVKDKVKCRYCHHVMSKACMELEHLIKHTRNYTLLYKCNVCEDNQFFLETNYYNIHLLAKHQFIDQPASLVPVPVRCLEMAGYTVPPRKILREPKTRENKNKTLDTTTVKRYNKKVKPANDTNKALNPNKSLNMKEKDDNIEEYINNHNEIDEMILYTNNENPEIALNEEDIKKEIEILNDTKEMKQESSDIKDVDENIKIKEEIVEEEDNLDKDMNILADINDLISDNIKMEVKEEPDDVFYEDDIIILNGNSIGDVNTADDPANDDVEAENKNDSDDDYEMDNNDNSDYSDTATRTYKRLYTCKRCNFQGTYNMYKLHKEKHINRKLRRRKKSFAVEKNLKCSRCKNKFKSLTSYLSHLKTHDYPELTCPHCMLKQPHHRKLIAHVGSEISKSFISVRSIRTTNGDRTFKHQCKKCQKEVKVSDFFQHWEQHLVMPGDKLNNSNWENYVPENPLLRECIALLLDVSQTHIVEPVNRNPRRRWCKMCTKSFARYNDIKRHCIEHLLDDAFRNMPQNKGLKCQICGEVFSHNSAYKGHMRYHASLPVYKCELCNKLFSDSSNFAKHKKVHNISVLTCDICKKKFSIKHQLIKHLKDHETLSPIICHVDNCKRVCYSQGSYNRHCRLVHLKQAMQFTCAICKERFSSLKDKWEHQWTIHRLRKTVADCPVCSKPFRKASDVKRHMQKAHTTTNKEAIDEEEDLEEVTELKIEPYMLYL